MNFLIIAGLICFVVIVVLRREYAIYLTVLLLPSYQIRFTTFGIPLTFLECLILITVTAFLAETVARKKYGEVWKNLRTTENIFVLLFLGASAIAVLVSPTRVAAAGIWKAYFLEPILFYFLLRSLINSPEKLQRLYAALAGLTLYLSAFGLYQFLTLQGLPVSWWEVGVAGRRIVSLLNHPNALALLLGPCLGMLIFLPQKNWLHRTAIALGLLAFYLTLSRAGWLALAAGTLGLALFTSYRKKIVALALVLICAVLLIPFSRHKLLDLAGGKDPTQENRYILWAAAGDMLRHSPITGVGLMGFHENFKNYPVGPDRVVQNYPHNFFLNFWLETGLLGLLAILALLALYYKKIRLLWTEKSKYIWSFAAGMAIVILHGLVDVSYFKNDLSVLFWLIFALPWLELD